MFIIRFLFPIDISGHDKLMSDECYVIIANHSSMLDAFLIDIALLKYPRVVVSSELFVHWYFPILAYIFDAIVIDHTVFISSIRECLTTLESNRSILIFPEGRISKDNKMGKWMRGAIYLSMKTKKRILPIALVGANKAWPSDTYMPKFSPISIKIIDPIIATSDYDIEIIKEKLEKFI